jgi:hypothetical protein
LKLQNITAEDIAIQNLHNLKSQIGVLSYQNRELMEKTSSPFRHFYFSSEEKSAFVKERLDNMGIAYRETDNGFECQECYTNDIRDFEKEFKPSKSSNRAKLREDVDRLIMQSKTYGEFLQKLNSAGYGVKQGKYLAVKHRSAQGFIRQKSLGEEYSEQALKNRINRKTRP